MVLSKVLRVCPKQVKERVSIVGSSRVSTMAVMLSARHLEKKGVRMYNVVYSIIKSLDFMVIDPC